MAWATRVLLLMVVTVATAQEKSLEDAAAKDSLNSHLPEEDEELKTELEKLGEKQYGYSHTGTTGLESFLKKLTMKNRRRNDYSEEKVLNSTDAHKNWGNSFVEIQKFAHRKCGGVRIKLGHVLTAAHCFFDAPQHNQNSGLKNCKDTGLINWRVNLLYSNGSIKQSVRIARVYKNGNFAENPNVAYMYSKDEALVVLANNFEEHFTEKFRLASSLHLKRPANSDRCYAVGLGHTEKGNKGKTALLPKVVHKGRVKILNCREQGFMSYSNMFSPFLCTETGGTHGDSGGVVVCYQDPEEHNLPYLMGVIEHVYIDESVTFVSNSMKHHHWLDKVLDGINRTGSILEKCRSSIRLR